MLTTFESNLPDLGLHLFKTALAYLARLLRRDLFKSMRCNYLVMANVSPKFAWSRDATIFRGPPEFQVFVVGWIWDSSGIGLRPIYGGGAIDSTCNLIVSLGLVTI